MKKLLLLASAMALMATPALANDQARHHCDMAKHHMDHGDMMQGMFDKMDTNHDGKITEKEFLAFHKKMFAKMDVNHDGAITMDEVKAMHEKMMEKHSQPSRDHEGWQGKSFTNRPAASSGDDERNTGFNQ